MSRRRTALVVAVLTLVTGCTSSAAQPPVARGASRPRAAAQAFLDSYVDPDGRVVRRDQGGDTVSEGQGYALLLAVVADDADRFDRVWRWTRDHLQRPDGLLSYRWADGRVADAMPAADADAQVAWALTLGAGRFGHAAYREQARRLAVAVVEHEVGYDPSGRPVLAAGPWAVARAPIVVEPGYWTPPAAQALADLTGDLRWRDLADGAPDWLARVSDHGRRLPSDWASVRGDDPTPTAAPDGSSPVQAGPDGLRAVVWAATDGRSRGLAAGWSRLLTENPAAMARRLDGDVLRAEPAPLSSVAAAAGASARGDAAERDRLLTAADEDARRFPTYYGSAWAALGRALLTTSALR